MHLAICECIYVCDIWRATASVHASFNSVFAVLHRLKHKRRKSETEPSSSDPSMVRFGGFLYLCNVHVYCLAVYELTSKSYVCLLCLL